MTLGWIFQDLKGGARLARKQPVVALTVVLALAIGIGTATTGFTFMQSVLDGELPFAGGDRFVRLSGWSEEDGGSVSIDPDRFRLLRDEADAFAYLGAIRAEPLNVLHRSGQPENLVSATLTPGWFRHLPWQPLVGRLFVPADGAPGAEPVVLIRESLWHRRYQRDPNVIGTTIDAAGVERVVVGVLPDACKFPNSGELWLPLESDRIDATASGIGRPAGIAGVLADGVSTAAALEQVRRLSSQFEASRPDLEPLRVDMRGFTDLSVLRIETPLRVATFITVMVLLLVAANVANLVLARNAARTSELAVRSALGASRGRVVGQLFLEVLLLGAVAAVLGVVASQVVMGAIERSFDADELPFWISFTPGPATIAFVVVVTLLATAVAGAWPAWRATRRDPSQALASDGPRSTTVGIGRFGSAMIVSETALSVALLSAAVVMAWGFARYAEQSVDLPRGEILTAQLYVAPDADVDDSMDAAQRSVLEAVARLPGVAAFGAASSLPRMTPRGAPIRVDVAPGAGASAPANAPAVGVRPGFFAALDGSIVAGRDFHEGDYARDAPPVAIVNQPFVDTFLGGRNPVGRRLQVVARDGDADERPWREIVGVVPDLGLLVGDADRAAGYYVPMRDRSLFYLALRAESDPMQLATPLRKVLYELDPDIVVTRMVPIEAVGEEDRSAFLIMSSVLTAIGGAALALSLVGMYAILSFAVTGRTREIGIRVALGAGHGRILRSVVGGAATLLGIGATIGGVLALGLARLLDRSLVAQLPDPGLWVFPAIALLMALAGLIASWVPVRRALRIRPTEALRQL